MGELKIIGDCYHKGLKIIDSCETIDHIVVTDKWLKLFNKKVESLFPNDSKNKEKIYRLSMVLRHKLKSKRDTIIKIN